MHVLLIGARGSGKTTVGHALAALLGRRCVDLDDLVLARFAQRTVRAVWAERGEAAWRDAEARTLQELLTPAGAAPNASDRCVIALGGGVPMLPEARALIERAASQRLAIVVYLETSAETLRRRLARDTGDRPSLTGSEPVDEIETVLRQREPTYRALADVIVTTDGKSANELAAEIAMRLDEPIPPA